MKKVNEGKPVNCPSSDLLSVLEFVKNMFISFHFLTEMSR